MGSRHTIQNRKRKHNIDVGDKKLPPFLFARKQRRNKKK